MGCGASKGRVEAFQPSKGNTKKARKASGGVETDELEGRASKSESMEGYMDGESRTEEVGAVTPEGRKTSNVEAEVIRVRRGSMVGKESIGKESIGKESVIQSEGTTLSSFLTKPSDEDEDERLKYIKLCGVLDAEEDLFQQLVDAALFVGKGKLAGISFVDRQSEICKCLAVSPGLDVTKGAFMIPRELSLVSVCLAGEHVVVPDASVLEDDLACMSIFAKFGMAFFIGVTIHVHSRSVGVLWLANDSPHKGEVSHLVQTLHALGTSAEKQMEMSLLQNKTDFLKAATQRLQTELRMATPVNDSTKDMSFADFSGPVENAVKMLGRIRDQVARTPNQGDMARQLDKIINMLTSGSSHVPLVLSNLGLDHVTKKWLMRDLMGGSAGFSQQIDPGTQSGESFGESKPSRPMSRVSSLELETHAVARVMDDWDLDIWDLDAKTAMLLPSVASALFEYYDLFETFQLPRDRCTVFFLRVAQGYEANPYHNYVHAADVMLACHHFLKIFKPCLQDIHILAVLFAALIHDYRHPGTSNSYQVASKSDVAAVYNDRSVLENFHCSQAFQVLNMPHCNIFADFSRELYSQLRFMVVDLVLATDLALHFEILSKFNNALNVPEVCYRKTPEAFSDDQRNLVLKMIIKCADVSHSARNLELHREWTFRIQDEFFAQGDKEKQNGLPISPFMDRGNTMVPKSQIGFLNFVVKPAFDALAKLIGSIPDTPTINVCLTNLSTNLKHWTTLAEKGDPYGGYNTWLEHRDQAVQLVAAKRSHLLLTLADSNISTVALDSDVAGTSGLNRDDQLDSDNGSDDDENVESNTKDHAGEVSRSATATPASLQLSSSSRQH